MKPQIEGYDPEQEAADKASSVNSKPTGRNRKIGAHLIGKSISNKEDLEIDLAEYNPTKVTYTSVFTPSSHQEGAITVVHDKQGKITAIYLDEH